MFDKGLGILIGFLAYVFGGFLLYLVGFEGLIVIMIPIICGYFFGHLIKSKFKKNKWINALAWLNTIVWIVPLFGLFTGTATIINENMDKKYGVLGGVGLFFSLTIIIINTILKIQENSNISFMEIFVNSEGNYTLPTVIIVMGIIHTYKSIAANHNEYMKEIKERKQQKNNKTSL